MVSDVANPLATSSSDEHEHDRPFHRQSDGPPAGPRTKPHALRPADEAAEALDVEDNLEYIDDCNLTLPAHEQERCFQRSASSLTRSNFGASLLLFICVSTVFLPFLHEYRQLLTMDNCVFNATSTRSFNKVFSFWFMPSICIYALLTGGSAVWSWRTDQGRDLLLFNSFFILMVGSALVELGLQNRLAFIMLSLFLVLINAQSICVRYGSLTCTVLTTLIVAYCLARAAAEDSWLPSILLLVFTEIIPSAMPVRLVVCVHAVNLAEQMLAAPPPPLPIPVVSQLVVYGYVNEARHRLLHLKWRALFTQQVVLEQEIANVDFVLGKTIPDFIMNLVKENEQAALTAYGSVLFADLKVRVSANGLPAC